MLSEAMNTYNPALHTLKEMGYIIKVIVEDEENFNWEASKNGIVITAFNPLSLLALVIIYEKYGDGWKEYNKIDLYDQILDESLENE